jgi:NADH-quinone oxidoreductase subunit J
MEAIGTNQPLAFWIISFVMIASAILVVTLRNIFHCALFLVLTLFCVAGIYVLLNAEFLAAAQVLIYVGAVAILMIFAVMLTSNLAGQRISQTSENGLIAFFVSGFFVVGVVTLIYYTTKIWNRATTPPPDENILIIGKSLMTKYMLPFEVVSVLLLSAMIGAIVLAREEKS